MKVQDYQAWEPGQTLGPYWQARTWYLPPPPTHWTVKDWWPGEEGYPEYAPGDHNEWSQHNGKWWSQGWWQDAQGTWIYRQLRNDA